jgi:hypothetical protein
MGNEFYFAHSEKRMGVKLHFVEWNSILTALPMAQCPYFSTTYTEATLDPSIGHQSATSYGY